VQLRTIARRNGQDQCAPDPPVVRFSLPCNHSVSNLVLVRDGRTEVSHERFALS